MAIESHRLVLTPWTPADSQPWRDLNADPVVRRFFPGTLDAEQADAERERMISALGQQGWGAWVVRARATDDFLGVVGFQRIPEPIPQAGSIEILWRFAQSAWGQGFATEAARACIEFGREALGFTEIFALTAELNTPSQAVMQRLGMEQIEHFLHPKLKSEHELAPHVLYRLTL